MQNTKRYCLAAWILAAVIWLLLVSPAKAEVIPSDYFSEVKSGTFYLYNVTQGKFLERLSNNFPGLSSAPAEVKVAKNGTAWTLMFADGKYLKTGYWNNQYLWTDGTSGLSENLWAFNLIGSGANVYQIQRTASETLNGQTGIFYVNGTNAATQPTDDCKWALISPDDYIGIAKANAIPAKYRSEMPTEEGQYYLYDMLNQTFLNTAKRTLSGEPKALVTFTPSGSSFLISGESGKYLKIGVYKGQYLWSDGDASNTKWTLEPAAGEEDEKLFYIYTNNFTETGSEVSGKTMYINGTNATSTKPGFARWALITEDDYVAYLSSGEGIVDPGEVAANKATMVAAKGDATSLLQNPTFERSSDGWWGGERGLNQLYRGSGYAFEASADGSVMLQTVKNMPKGTYKVVAAVRGASGTTVCARLADNSGNAVVNHGTNAVTDQLNMNGVKMPYTALGGFNSGENALGWDWATATATLNEDGNLKIEFVTVGNGKVSVSDVHLYYMSDGTDNYAVEYTDGVDATAHAVTCDLTAANPNRLFTSTGTITTINGAKLYNNLVGGTVANLVIREGYDFTATADFIANKATYYGNMTAGTAKTICLPFAITGGAKGSFYEPKNISGSTLNLTEVKRPEAGKAYLYRGNEDVTSVSGSGNVKATPVSTRMEGSFVATNDVPAGSYVLSGSTLKRVSGSASVGAFNAYVKLESSQSRLNLNFDTDEDDGVWKKPEVTVGDFAAGQICYLYNTGAKRFYTEGNDHGTQASIGETGLKVKFVQNGDAVKLTNYSETKTEWRTMFITTNGAMFVDGESVTECYWQVVPSGEKTFKLMMAAPNVTYNQANYPGAVMGLDLFEAEQQTRLAAFLFADEEPGEGLYLTDWAVVSIADYNTYMDEVATYKTALQLKDLIEEATAAGIDVSDEQLIYENTSSTQEELTAAIVSVTNKMIEDELKDASREHPLDLTAKFITNPSYENNDNEGWSGTTPTIDVNANLQNAEFFNKETVNYYQNLVGLPDGVYRLSVQGFYRAGLEGPAYESKMSGNEDAVMHAKLYVTTGGKTATKSMQSIFTGAPTSKLGVSGEINLGNWWVPNTMSSAAAYFAAGYYLQNSIEVTVSDSKLRIGIQKSEYIRRDWLMIDNWKLEYLGKE